MAKTFAELNIADALVSAASALGFSTPTDLQQRVVPVILDGTDLLLQAHSGSGRSLAYLLPLMHRLLEHPPAEGRGPRALIMSLNRDTAMKVGRTIKELGRESALRFGTVVGGRPYPMQHQLLRRPLDILVATPTRLMDHIQRGRVPFERLEMLVIDRADEMVEMDLAQDLRFIATSSPARKQTLVLAARLTEKVRELSVQLQDNPLVIETEDQDAAQVGERPEDKAQASPDGRRRSHHVRTGQARKARPAKRNGGAPPRGEVNGNVLSSSGQPKPKAKTRQSKPAKNGLRGPGRRVNGAKQGRRQPEVRFPSDYANGPRAGAGPDLSERREALRREPMQQYLADYGFSAGSRARKPVTVVYRGKGRKVRSNEKTDNKDDEA